MNQCVRDYAAQPDGPSLTTRCSTLIAKTKARDGCCVITSRASANSHGAHTFPYALGRTQQKAALDIWKVLEMFWGAERKDQLLQLIFGPHDRTTPNSKTQINALSNMLTLSPDSHDSWAEGDFTLGAAWSRSRAVRVESKISMDAPEVRKSHGN